MSAGHTPRPAVKSAIRTLDLIEYVVANPTGVVAQEIAAALAIPVSSLSYLLATLVERTYLHRIGRRYFAGPGLDRLRKPEQESTLAERARPLIKAMRLQLNETASLFEEGCGGLPVRARPFTLDREPFPPSGVGRRLLR